MMHDSTRRSPERRAERSARLRIAALLCAVAGCGATAATALSPELSDVVAAAQEPRFVAPTRRDRIGRIWAPVTINGKQALRFVLDTGASRSAITAQAAGILGLTPDPANSVLLRGVTGSLSVPTIRIDSYVVGDVIMAPIRLPVIADALGGAQGVLGSDDLGNMRIVIDFGHDAITIAHSRGERADADLVAIPFERRGAGLLMVRALVAGVRVHAIIDTGAEATIGNEAMRAALVRRNARGIPDEVVDVTSERQAAEAFPSPPVALGKLQIRGARISYGDMHIFEYWQLLRQPALLIGMDVLGLLDILIIDYRRHEVLLRTRGNAG
jgi:predicted aspartyl protease